MGNCFPILAVIISHMFAEHLDEKVIKIGGLIEYLHTASLIIDDIEDGSILRR
jgi:geranylgeranyl pyrophosphate synthase